MDFSPRFVLKPPEALRLYDSCSLSDSNRELLLRLLSNLVLGGVDSAEGGGLSDEAGLKQRALVPRRLQERSSSFRARLAFAAGPETGISLCRAGGEARLHGVPLLLIISGLLDDFVRGENMVENGATDSKERNKGVPLRSVGDGGESGE